jgi:hypothetical protein
MRLNLGCGYVHLPVEDDWVNVDSDPGCNPDVVCELDTTYWDFAEDSSVSEVTFQHSLEHMGETVDGFRHIIRELYRVCEDGAVVYIAVPHPRHDDFLNDPTHVRVITPAVLSLLDKRNNAFWREQKAANSCLADAWEVDFHLESINRQLDHRQEHLKDQPAILEKLEATQNNIVKEYQMVMRCVK